MAYSELIKKFDKIRAYMRDFYVYGFNQIVEYVIHNGMLKDMAVLQEPPFTDQGSVVDIFPDMSIWQGIRAVIKQINANAGIA